LRTLLHQFFFGFAFYRVTGSHDPSHRFWRLTPFNINLFSNWFFSNFIIWYLVTRPSNSWFLFFSFNRVIPISYFRLQVNQLHFHNFWLLFVLFFNFWWLRTLLHHFFFGFAFYKVTGSHDLSHRFWRLTPFDINLFSNWFFLNFIIWYLVARPSNSWFLLFFF
jgi:hypothetical protein